jgi:hypothetical protein
MAGKIIDGSLNTLLNNNMLQLSYLIVIFYSISIVLFLYSLAHFNLLLNYLKSKTKDQSSQYNLENPEEILSSRYNYLFIMKNIRTIVDYYCTNELIHKTNSKFRFLTIANDDSVLKQLL